MWIVVGLLLYLAFIFLLGQFLSVAKIADEDYRRMTYRRMKRTY